MTIPYRTKRLLLRLGTAALFLLLAAALIWACWAVWLGRFVVYGRDGARLDLNRSAEDIQGVTALAPAQDETVAIYYNEGENQLGSSKELAPISGYYVTAQELEEDLSAVHGKISKLERGSAVMVDVKGITGNFFYDSTVSTDRNSYIDPAAMGQLIEDLNTAGMYTIARLPAFRDFNYGLHHVPDGLPTAGGYLWMDDSRCYWLNPASQGTITYLTQIITELKGLGFDEVVLYDFRFPDTQSIVFSGDRAEAIAQAASVLATTCAQPGFTLSFVGDASFPLPGEYSRLYVENAAPAEAAGIAQQTGLEKPDIHLVFLTELHDTRFDTFSVLRPLTSVN